MEEIASRFPLLSKAIFNSLENQSITKCRGVSKFWQIHLDQQKYIQIRIIKAKIGAVDDNLGDAWKRIFDLSSTEIIIELGLAVGKFSYKLYKHIENLTPIHMAASSGNLQLLISILEKSEDKNPEDKDGFKAIHCAACHGHVETLEFLGETYNEINPGSKNG